MRLLIVGFVASLALLAGGCTSDSGSAAERPGATAVWPTQLSEGDVCPVTIPGQPYVARAPYLPEPPAYYHSVWYGSDDLWTMLKPGGAILDVKTFWWSRNFNINAEPYPDIVVPGRGSTRLGVSAPPLAALI